MTLIEDEFDETLVIVRRSVPSALVVAVRVGGQLPHVRSAGHHPADVVSIRRAVRDQLGLDAIVLDCRSVSLADGVVRRLLVLECLESATTDLNWVAPHSISGEPLQAALRDELVRVSAEQAAPVDGRDWTVSGWWARATAWITQEVQAAHLGTVLAIEQIRAWEFSCVLRVQTDRTEVYFKALPRSYAHEPRLAQYLAAWRPGSVPDVVATNGGERWLLMRACRGQCLEEGAPVSAWEHAAASYAELQVASTMQAQTLQALGCTVRGPLELRTLVGPLLADERALLGPGEHGLSIEEVRRIRGLRSSLEAACDELADSGIPLALEHGDLWSSNVYVSDSEVQFIDWTDACLSHPFFSLMPLLQSAAWDLDPAAVATTQARLSDRYLERWMPFASRERLRRALALARPLAALHIAATYWRAIPEPHLQWWIPRMVPFFVRMALDQWDAR